MKAHNEGDHDGDNPIRDILHQLAVVEGVKWICGTSEPTRKEVDDVLHKVFDKKPGCLGCVLAICKLFNVQGLRFIRFFEQTCGGEVETMLNKVHAIENAMLNAENN